jgi:hypothetical protein
MWRGAAAALDERGDVLSTGLALVQRAWDSPAGHRHADELSELIASVRRTADVARYNARHLEAVASASAGGGPDAEAYANVAAALTDPRAVAGLPMPRMPGTAPVALTDAPAPPAGSAHPQLAASDGPAVPPDGEPDVGGAELPDVVGWMVTAAPPAAGAVPAFAAPATARPAVTVTVPLTAAVPPPAPWGVASTLAAALSPPAAQSGAATVPSGPAAAPSGAAAASTGPPAYQAAAASAAAPAETRPAPSRATAAARRGAEDEYVDGRGNQVRIRWADKPS